MGPVILIMLALYLWPLVIQSFLTAMFAVSVITHVPGIYARFRWGTWLWLALLGTLVAQAIGSALVMQAPAVASGSMAPQPSATLGLLLSAWSLLGWVVATELTARQDYLSEASLDSHLTPF